MLSYESHKELFAVHRSIKQESDRINLRGNDYYVTTTLVTTLLIGPTPFWLIALTLTEYVSSTETGRLGNDTAVPITFSAIVIVANESVDN